MANLPSVNDIIVIDTSGEWPTKSGGVLSVLHKIDYSLVEKFLHYDSAELSAVLADIRGLRAYKVSDIPKGSVGANEWHKIRNEIVCCIAGTFTWVCKDVYGNEKTFTLDKNCAIYTPHHILHTYTALEDAGCISVLANTLFDPKKPATHDTYSANDFMSVA